MGKERGRSEKRTEEEGWRVEKKQGNGEANGEGSGKGDRIKK